MLVLLTAIAGGICLWSGYTTLRDQGPAFWPLSLMLCMLAAASWTLTVRLLRSRREAGEATPPDPNTQTSGDDQSYSSL